jgi:hypothetical protein
MPVELLLDLVPLIGSALLFLWFLPGAVRAVQTSTGTRTRRQEDVTGQAPVPDDETKGRIVALNALGYRRLGETRTRIPAGDVVGWVLGADDGAAYVLLAPGAPLLPGLTGFYSAWPDGTWLGTIHPHGSPLDYRSLHLRIDSRGLAEVDAGHRLELNRLADAHGPPRPVRTLADVLVLDADYRERFGGRELRPLLARALVPAAIALAMTLISVAALATKP